MTESEVRAEAFETTHDHRCLDPATKVRKLDSGAGLASAIFGHSNPVVSLQWFLRYEAEDATYVLYQL